MVSLPVVAGGDKIFADEALDLLQGNADGASQLDVGKLSLGKPQTESSFFQAQFGSCLVDCEHRDFSLP